MNCSMIGNTYAYYYNPETKKLSSKDGRNDEFVLFFNDELAARDSTELNCLDSRKKSDISRVIKEIEHKRINNPLDDSKRLYEVSWVSEDVETTKTYFDGKLICTGHTGGLLSRQELEEMSSLPFKTITHKDYDPEENCMNIAVGDTYNIDNDYAFEIKKDGIEIIGNGGDTNYPYYIEHLRGSLEFFIRFADQQWTAGSINDEDMQYIIGFLQDRGVDLNRSFTINGTKCEINKSGRIQEVGNTHGIPSLYYEKMMKRVEEAYYVPLNKSVYAEKG